MKRPARKSYTRGVFVILIGIAVMDDGRSVHAATLRFADPPSPINFLEASDACVEEQRVRFAPSAPITVGGRPVPAVASDIEEDAPSMSTAATSPVPIASFAGMEGQFTVPDTMGTVGPQHVVTALNNAIRIQDRSGRVLGTMDDEAFWSSGGTRYHYDPRALYDHARNRWVIVAAYREENDAGIAVAVSRTGDPTGSWERRRFRTIPGNWVDYPTVGLNEQSLSVAMLSVDDDGEDRLVIYVFDKGTLYALPAGTVTANYITAPPGTLMPVVVYGTNQTGTYFVQAVPYGNSVRIYRESPSALVEIATVPARQSWSEFTPLLPQLGTGVRISPEDTRVTNAVLRNGALWFAQTVFLPAAQATRSAIQWWKVSLDGRLLDFGRIDDPSGAVSYCFPSIAVNRNNDVVIGFSQISAASYPTAGYAVRSALDPPGTFRPSVVLKHGDAPYGDARWGDYSATVIDPDDVTFWTVQEYAKTPVGGPRWGVWWGHVPAPAAPPVGRRRSARH
jgi:hypothetical protein